MKVLFDTSVLVAACVGSHPEHARCRSWLARALGGEVEMVVSTHTLAELYATLSGLPVRPRIGPSNARRLVRENVERHAQLVALSATDYRAVLDLAAETHLAGGVVFDALIARAAEKARVDHLLTLNPRDFERAWPTAGERVATP